MLHQQHKLVMQLPLIESWLHALVATAMTAQRLSLLTCYSASLTTLLYGLRDYSLTVLLHPLSHPLTPCLSQRAPSSFNAQPYRCIIVDDAAVKSQLADAMLGRNTVAVATAPVTVVFLADLSRQLCSSLCDHFGCCIAGPNLIPHQLTSTSFTPPPPSHQSPCGVSMTLWHWRGTMA